MRSTNRLLIDLGAELFASCLYLHLDPAREVAVMARAGHPPPLLLRPDGRVRVLDLAGGPLLGIDAAATYPTTEVPFVPGSVLALYTDGLIESPAWTSRTPWPASGENSPRPVTCRSTRWPTVSSSRARR